MRAARSVVANRMGLAFGPALERHVLAGKHDKSEEVSSACEAILAERERAGAEVEALILGLLEGEYSHAHLGFNDNNCANYATVAEAVETWPDFEDWVSPEERQKAIATNRVWTLQWYPQTPVGFCILRASSLSALLDAIRKGDAS